MYINADRAVPWALGPSMEKGPGSGAFPSLSVSRSEGLFGQISEVTGLGLGAFENADIPETELIAWNTTRPSKQEALAKLQALVENQ